MDLKLPLFFQDNGVERPETLILVHGSGGSSSHWPAQWMHQKAVRIVTVDLPGHGQSPGPACRTVADYADALIQLVQQQHLTRVILGGHSLGGAIVQWAALRRPNWLAGLVLVGTGARLRVLPQVLTGLKVDYPSAATQIARMALGPSASAILTEALHQGYLDLDPEVLYGDLSACDGFDIISRLSEITVPALVVAGDQDRLTPPKYARYLTDHLPQAQLVMVPGAGHMMALEYPDGVGEVILQFCRSVFSPEKGKNRLKGDN